MNLNENTTVVTEPAEVTETTDTEVDYLIPYDIKVREGSSITAKDIKEVYDEIKEMNKLQTLRYFTKIKGDVDMCNLALEFIKTATDTREMVEGFSESIDSLSDNKIITKKAEDIKAAIEQAEDFDAEGLTKEVNEYLDKLAVASDIAKAHIAYLKEINGETCMAEDIIDTLIKNQNTLKESSMLNAPLYIKAIDEAIIEISDIGLTGKMTEDSLRRLKTKLEVPKRIIELAKTVYTDQKATQKALRKAGFEYKYIESFTNFMLIEKRYSENVLGETSGMEDDMLLHTVLLFFFHIAKIVDAEVSKHRYKTLVFKMYALRVLEIAAAYPIDVKDPMGCRNKDGVETELSQIRQSTYKIYLEILKKYDLPRVREYARKTVKSFKSSTKDVIKSKSQADIITTKARGKESFNTEKYNTDSNYSANTFPQASEDVIKTAAEDAE